MAIDDLPPRYAAPELRGRGALIAASYVRLTGRALVPPGADPVAALWAAPSVIVAHGTEVDPIFFFGNRAALARFDASVEAFTALPSRLSAEPMQRDARQALLDRVARDGFVDDYSGVRVSLAGRRFRIERATVWNLVDADGSIRGQAAAFAQWIDLPATGVAAALDPP